MPGRANPRVTIVGLGPGGDHYVTEQTRQAIAAAPHRLLRTAVHPSADLIGGAENCDDLYDSGEDFDAVYRAIVERVVARATQHGELLYAVPGSPLILERTVALLLNDSRVTCEVLPAMSFLDLVYARLRLDPVEAGLTLIDGHRFAEMAAGRSGPLLIAHTHANWVLSEIKLAVDDAGDDAGDMDDRPVTILKALGTDAEEVIETTWSDLDRATDADHLTSVYVPSLGATPAAEYGRFHQLAQTLREQCPWDREQTHQTLVPYLLEETYEVVDALHALNPDDDATDVDLIEELGDLLYQIEFHSVIAEQEGRFTITDVVRGVHDKLVRRHPHVFGSVEADDSETVVSNWDAIKREEKGRTSVFDGVASSQPSLMYAWAVQRKAARVGFDWPDVEGPLAKITEETAELRAATTDDERLHELGDLLFSVVNVARHLQVEPEAALRAAAQRFRDRFAIVEQKAQERGVELSAAGLDQLDAWWDEAKIALGVTDH